MKKRQDAMSMINQLADLNNIDDTDLMAACFGVGMSLLFIYKGDAGLKKCQESLCEMAELTWNRVEEAKREIDK